MACMTARKGDPMTIRALLLAATAALTLTACAPSTPAPTPPAATAPAPVPAGIGTITRLSPASFAVLPDGVSIERLTEDRFSWSEGPLWISDAREAVVDGRGGGFLLFTDVPQNTLYKWSESGGLSTFLKPAGFQGDPDSAEASIFREPGANGLIWAGDDTILMGDHGNRAVSQMRLSSKTKSVFVDSMEGYPLNSPNDLVMAADGTVYFTDPPYGLKGLDDSPAKDLPFNGVYRKAPNAPLEMIDRVLTFPNGIILSPDERYLYVAVSDPMAAKIHRYSFDETGKAVKREVFFDFTKLVPFGQGLPDGMAMSEDGYLFATGPAGIHVFAPDTRVAPDADGNIGERIAVISTGTAAANVTFGGADGRTLYITSGAFLARVDTAVKGMGLDR